MVSCTRISLRVSSARATHKARARVGCDCTGLKTMPTERNDDPPSGIVAGDRRLTAADLRPTTQHHPPHGSPLPRSPRKYISPRKHILCQGTVGTGRRKISDGETGHCEPPGTTSRMRWSVLPDTSRVRAAQAFGPASSSGNVASHGHTAHLRPRPRLDVISSTAAHPALSLHQRRPRQITFDNSLPHIRRQQTAHHEQRDETPRIPAPCGTPARRTRETRFATAPSPSSCRLVTICSAIDLSWRPASRSEGGRCRCSECLTAQSEPRGDSGQD